ncbi:PLC-like phosphodiesterase [Fistulina hepatica ATCC 64428]|uniref:Phosphoinositide phospholipase C n=1 Tax=Fistulina hepatica ATCC 64428 TaxID=1128425 RepID=A0A0D7ARD6_9AGAR|nr:PLC-like phosphodiesterase [Fistulina hepatica ATCC 64428]
MAQTSPTESSDFTIPDVLKRGTMLTKISEKKRKHVLFKLDPDEGRILYESRRRGIKQVPIEAIKELRSGSDSRYYRELYKFPPSAEDRWITVIYILDGKYKTIHLVADTPDVFKLWDSTLRKLYEIRQGLMSGLGNVETRQAVWERQYWKDSDEQGDNRLEYNEVQRMCLKLGVKLPAEDLQKHFKEADVQGRGYLDYPGFQRFVKLLKRRPELEQLYQKLCQKYGGQLDLAAFASFMRDTQKSTLTYEELKAIFKKYSTSEVSGVAILTLDDFDDFLLSPDNSPWPLRDLSVWQDMTRPISEYFISSSHNTYLVGNQLVGVSTVEGYIRALLHSCRTVELDIYNGDEAEGPVVYHGKTLTSKVLVKDICEAINKYAFVASQYPVMISAEVHCSVKQQDAMVDIMSHMFGDKLIRVPANQEPPKIERLPSPEQLKGKILLKAKNITVSAELEATFSQRFIDPAKEAKSTDTTSSSSISEPGLTSEIHQLKSKWHKDPLTPPEKPKMSLALASLLVYTVGVRCFGLAHPDEYAPQHVFSVSENKANRMKSADAMRLIEYTQTHLVRIYPKGTRVSSTNYAPHRFWAVGAQIVAINWQTFDLGYMLNQTMFRRNGGSGYILKPAALRPGSTQSVNNRTEHFLDVTIISAQQLPRPKDKEDREKKNDSSVVDPYVEVVLCIPDWTETPFIPKDSGAQYSEATEATSTSAGTARTVSFRTPAVENNGFNPVWQEELCLPFDCVGDMMDLVFVKFAVRQRDDRSEEPLAVYCSSLGGLEQGEFLLHAPANLSYTDSENLAGFRHLPLHDTQMSQHLFSTLFVEIGIREASEIRV